MRRKLVIRTEFGSVHIRQYREYVVIDTLIVRKNWRRHGHGTRLVDLVKEVAGKRPIEGYVKQMDTVSVEELQAFWQKQGAQFVGSSNHFRIEDY